MRGSTPSREGISMDDKEMKMRHTCMALSLLVLVGCNMPTYKSVNAQRSAIRGGGDIAATLSLDAVNTGEQAEAIAKKTEQICIAIDKFLGDGKVADLTIPEITGELRKLIPADYQFLFDMLIAQISGQTVPVQKIGANNIKRMKALCEGVIIGCNRYSVADRPVIEAARDLNKAAGPATPAAFGAMLKAEMAKRNVK